MFGSMLLSCILSSSVVSAPAPLPTSVPCILGDKVQAAHTKLDGLPLKILESGVTRNPVLGDNLKRIKSQNPVPGAAVPSPLPLDWAVVVELHGNGPIQPNVVPCLVDEFVIEAKAKLGDIPIKVREESDPPGVFVPPNGGHDTRKVEDQSVLPGTPVTRPLATSYFVGATLYPVPPPPAPEPPPTSGPDVPLWVWILAAIVGLAILIAFLKKLLGSSGP